MYLLHAKKRVDEVSSAPAPMTPDDTAAPPAPAASPVSSADSESGTSTPAADSPVSPAPSVPAVVSAPPARRRVFFRYNGVDSHYGNVAWIDLAAPKRLHFIDTLRCEVVYVSGGHGICLSAKRGVFTSYAASLFDARTFEVSGTYPLKGIPSRSRVSVDGSLAAFTVFVSGHGYTTLDFSTQTLLIDTKTGAEVADLETFEVRRNGGVIKEADFNFWGVTFTADAREFYATLSTGGKHYLIRGDIAARTAEVIHENVECPSLSPDARSIAYKKRLNVDNRVVWQLHVLDLATSREIPLAEKRSIDDQLEWLDNRHVLYSVPSAEDGSSPSTDVWMASIDAKTAPRVFVRNAYSPASERCSDAAACAAAP